MAWDPSPVAFIHDQYLPSSWIAQHIDHSHDISMYNPDSFTFQMVSQNDFHAELRSEFAKTDTLALGSAGDKKISEATDLCLSIEIDHDSTINSTRSASCCFPKMLEAGNATTTDGSSNYQQNAGSMAVRDEVDFFRRIIDSRPNLLSTDGLVCLAPLKEDLSTKLSGRLHASDQDSSPSATCILSPSIRCDSIMNAFPRESHDSEPPYHFRDSVSRWESILAK
jgi:hypothetical protein